MPSKNLTSPYSNFDELLISLIKIVKARNLENLAGLSLH